MNLMERNRQTVRLERVVPCRDADAPHTFGSSVMIGAVLSPHAADGKAGAPGAMIAQTAQMLYDGGERVLAGMSVLTDAGTAEQRRYRVEAVRRYPWLQVAELRLTEDA